MNFKQEELMKQLEQEVKKRFPDVVIEEPWEKDDGSIAVRVSTPHDDAWEIAESMAPLSVDILSYYGYLIYVVPATRDRARLAQTSQPVGGLSSEP